MSPLIRLDPATASSGPAPTAPPTVPAWALPPGGALNDADAAFQAGAALIALNTLARAQSSWTGAWRQRLALNCAAASMRLAGRAEEAAALRDAWHLRLASTVRRRGDRRSRRGHAARLQDFRLVTGRPGAGAKAALAAAAAAHYGAGFWSGPPRRRRRRLEKKTGEQNFERAVCVALAQAAAEACRLAAELARRAEKLLAVAPKLRAKGAGEVIFLLLNEDAVPGSLTTKNLSRFAARRLFERLQQLDAVRELSGRTTFRLFGL